MKPRAALVTKSDAPPALGPGALFDLALAHHRQGRHAEARSLCRKVLQQEPSRAQALHLSGVLALAARELPLAIEHLERAAALDERAAYLATLGDAYRLAGRVEAAVSSLSRAVELEPELTQAILALGFIALERGYLEQAATRFERCITLQPSEAMFQRAYGATCFALGKLAEAEEHLRVALALQPDAHEAELDLAQVLIAQRSYDTAIPFLRRLRERLPKDAGVHRDLGIALCHARQLDESLSCIHRALELDAGQATTHHALGQSLLGLGRAEEAVSAYRRAVELEPSNDGRHSALVYMLALCPGVDDALILAEARRWEVRHAQPRSAAHPSPTAGRTLRVGYVSADLCRHVVGYFLLPLLEQHDRSSVEVFCYSNTKKPDDVTARYRSRSDVFRDVSRLSDDELAQRIRDDGIDILVDLSMHTDGGRLAVFARKPAPVQVSWLAYPGTTGLSSIDYRLTDPHVDPPSLGFPSSETSWRLPDTLWCFRPTVDDTVPNVEAGPLPALSSGRITFGAFTSFNKVNDGTLVRWASVMRAVDESRLVLHAPAGQSASRVRTLLEKNGVAAHRIELVGQVSRTDYLTTYHRIDIVLDTLPHSGNTTSLEAWWMGVPVLSQVGTTIAGRGGACFTQNLGLPEWAAPDADGLVAAASRLTQNLSELATLRAGLRSRMERSPLMDYVRFARNVELAYKGMWQRWCEQHAAT